MASAALQYLGITLATADEIVWFECLFWVDSSHSITENNAPTYSQFKREHAGIKSISQLH